MRRNMKKLCCAILCACLLLMNTPGSMSYAENMEQNASDTDAVAAEVQDATEVSYVVEETAKTATDTDAECSDIISATSEDVLLYAASEDESGGAYKIEINSQADWDNLFTSYSEDNNPVVIILNTDITLSKNTVLSVNQTNPDPKKFQISGNGHSIAINKYDFVLQSNTVAIENTHFKNGTVQVYNTNIGFSCTDSQFSAAFVKFSAGDLSAKIDFTRCKFYNCPEDETKTDKEKEKKSCIYSKGAPCPVSFSDCTMDNCGLLFSTETSTETYPCKVSFSGITATNCTGPVIGKTADSKDYIIESISNCQLSTQTPGITAIAHYRGSIGEITGCTITGFDTGIKLFECDASFGTGSDIDTLTISDTTITDCITGVDINNLSGYENAMISNLTMTARKGVSDTVGYKGSISLTSNSFFEVDYDFNQMPQIKSCHISGFDTGIDLSSCPVVVSDCEITDCNSGIKIQNDPVAILDTTLQSRASAADSIGVTNESADCYLIDSDINDFNVGSDFSSGNVTIIGCRYNNRETNLKSTVQTCVYDTSFIGGETSVIADGSTLYFYGCVVEGKPDTTISGISIENTGTLHIYSLNRPYSTPFNGVYDKLKQYTDRTMNNGKSEIFNCETGISSERVINFADTHIHDCGTGIKSSVSTYSYGNNLIEDCVNGMEVQGLFKQVDATFTDTYVDTIRNCSNDGLSTAYISTTSPARLEIYDCGNYGIKNTGSISAIVDVHNCKTGIYMGAGNSTVLNSDSKVYDNLEWNVYAASSGVNSTIIIQGSEGTLTNGEKYGNIYWDNNNTPIIDLNDLYSDDSVYYLGTKDVRYILNVNNLYGTVVIDTTDEGYKIGRKVALLGRTDITSQMFAKKEGFVIQLEMEGTNMYAVFAAGCDVTYDVTTNGGDTFDGEKLSDEEIKDGKLPKISYLVGENIDLTYTASKTGYEFVGWNTDKDATEGLEPDTLTAEQKDITLYAIYKKTAYVNYHTYDAALDYRTAVTVYNNQDIECELDIYNAGGDKTFVGYVLDENATVSSADDVLAEGATVTGSPDGLDVYCVYSKQGQLKYLKKNGTTLSTENKTVYDIAAANNKFVYTIRAGEPVAGFTFTGWKDEAGNSFVAGSTLSTEDNLIVLTPVYVVGDEPTPEVPTPETPTPEEPTPETPTPETPVPGDPVIQPPTTETSTTQAPSGPVTGDSTNPIGVIGLGILSLLGILVLTMKKKRKN